MPDSELPEIQIDELPKLSPTARFRVKLFSFWGGLSRPKKATLEAGFLLLFISLISLPIWVFSRLSGQSIAPSGVTPTPTPIVTIVLPTPAQVADHESPLTGIKITQAEYEAQKLRKPMAVMVDNLVEARPQSGLDKADLVYEALVEGGISRFMPIFLSQQPEKVGPVRSIRAYFLDWIAELDDALFMHIGGAGGEGVNPEANALAKIQNYGMKSVGISVGDNFWRVNDRSAPHNAYSSLKSLWEKVSKSPGWSGPWNLQTWQFKDDEAPDARGNIANVSFDWDGWGAGGYSVVWNYDLNQNNYLRQQGGVNSFDAQTNQQLTAKNVVLEFSKQTLANDYKAHILYQTSGTGRALVFEDGKAIEGFWKKAERTSRAKFYDASGAEIKFNRGQTWIEVVPDNSEVTYR